MRMSRNYIYFSSPSVWRESMNHWIFVVWEVKEGERVLLFCSLHLRVYDCLSYSSQVNGSTWKSHWKNIYQLFYSSKDVVRIVLNDRSATAQQIKTCVHLTFLQVYPLHSYENIYPQSVVNNNPFQVLWNLVFLDKFSALFCRISGKFCNILPTLLIVPTNCVNFWCRNNV